AGRALVVAGREGPAGQIAPVEVVVASAAIADIQETVFLDFRVVGLGDGVDERVARLRQRQFFLEVDFVDVAGGRLVGTAHADFAVNAAGPEYRRVDQVRPIGGDDDHDVLEGFQPVHFRAEHRHQSGKDVRDDTHPVA